MAGGGGGEYLNHFVTVRSRITGSGSLNLKLLSLDEIRVLDLPDINLSATTNRYVNTLCNFVEQKAQLEIRADALNDAFQLDQIIFFIKPIATGYPQ